ncbi:MAG: SIMPL domain-containing protein [Salinarimonas sp.]|nr:SIMPL domain-containing protein [Salinarimonas sp.]
MPAFSAAQTLASPANPAPAMRRGGAAIRTTLAGALFAALLIVPLSAQAGEGARDGRIVVSGSGTVERAPDYARIHISVTTRSETVVEAVDANNDAVEAALARLEARGIAREDIETAGFRVFETPESRRNDDSLREQPGFTASHQLRIKTRDIDDVGVLAGDILGLEGMTFQGLDFALDDDRDAQDEARRRAVADATRQAGVLADAAGVSLGRLMLVGDAATSAISMRSEGMMMARMDAASPVPIVPPASLGYEASVRMEWAISE